MSPNLIPDLLHFTVHTSQTSSYTHTCDDVECWNRHTIANLWNILLGDSETYIRYKHIRYYAFSLSHNQQLFPRTIKMYGFEKAWKGRLGLDPIIEKFCLPYTMLIRSESLTEDTFWTFQNYFKERPVTCTDNPVWSMLNLSI